jgi:hypothetical protein
MNLSCGIVGLPNVGKSTLFNAILARQVADCANYPFCTIEPNVGVVEVPDERLPVLATFVGTQKIVPAIVKFVDIAGLVAGAHKGEGLGNKFISHIREVDLILYVLRAFEDSEIILAGSVDPQADFETLQTELILADLETLEKQKEVKGAKAPKDIIRNEVVQKLKAALNAGKTARSVELSKEEKEEMRSLNLLTAKRAMAVFNISEKDIGRTKEMMQEMEMRYPKIFESVSEVIPVSAKIEFELKSLSFEDRVQYLKSLGIEKSGLDILIPQVFYALGLINFLTAGEKEVRAWTIEKGTDAQHAAGAIHSDFERNFVRAAVIPCEEFVQYKGWKGAQEAGKVRYEGKEYAVKDGDVVEFMVNV